MGRLVGQTRCPGRTLVSPGREGGGTFVLNFGSPVALPSSPTAWQGRTSLRKPRTLAAVEPHIAGDGDAPVGEAKRRGIRGAFHDDHGIADSDVKPRDRRNGRVSQSRLVSSDPQRFALFVAAAEMRTPGDGHEPTGESRSARRPPLLLIGAWRPDAWASSQHLVGTVDTGSFWRRPAGDSCS